MAEAGAAAALAPLQDGRAVAGESDRQPDPQQELLLCVVQSPPVGFRYLRLHGARRGREGADRQRVQPDSGGGLAASGGEKHDGSCEFRAYHVLDVRVRVLRVFVVVGVLLRYLQHLQREGNL